MHSFKFILHRILYKIHSFLHIHLQFFLVKIFTNLNLMHIQNVINIITLSYAKDFIMYYVYYLY